MRQSRAIALAASALCFWALMPAAASADATAFIGANTSPANRLARGFAIGAGLLIIGFEFEYADTSDDPAANAPSVKSGTGNVMLQTPVSFYGFQPYFTAGGGIYHESLGSKDNTGFAVDLGGGVKMSLIGPVRLRVDYRVFNAGGGALSPAHRFYVGLNVKF